MSGGIQSEVKRDETGRFIVPPVSPGRPKGARNKLGEAFIEALHDDFNEHGVSAIAEVRETKPDQYLKVIASLLPKDVNLNLTEDTGELSDEQLLERIRSLTARLAPLLADGFGGDNSGAGATPSTQVAARVH